MNVSVHILLNVTKLISCTFHSKNRKHTKDAQKRHLPSLFFFFFFVAKGEKKRRKKTVCGDFQDKPNNVRRNGVGCSGWDGDKLKISIST